MFQKQTRGSKKKELKFQKAASRNPFAACSKNKTPEQQIYQNGYPMKNKEYDNYLLLTQALLFTVCLFL